jgi:hypothetical protein
MINIIKYALEVFLDKINTENTNMTEEDQIDTIRLFSRILDKDERISKIKACEYLEISRSKFDSLVSNGFIPKGRKEDGFKELSWSKFDLDLYKMKYANQE